MKLMTFEEYKKSGEHPVPYMFEISRSGKELFYFGERHSFDPSHKEWDILKKYWQSFLDMTKNKKRIVFVEGGKRPVLESEEESILKHGGMGIITFLASKEGIETFSPEPSDEFERKELLKAGFSKEEIQYYYFARTVHQWGRLMDPKPDFDTYIERFLNADKKEGGWNDFDFSLNHMKSIHHNLFNREFVQNDFQFFSDIVDPVQSVCVINRVASTNIRDPYIINEIKKYWDNGYSIFVQYGSSHAVIEEPVLKEIL